MTTADREAAHFFLTYKRLPLDILRGEGPWLVMRDGTRYLDMFAGLAVNALGYAHPRVTAAICEQAGKYNHLSNYFLQEPQVDLADLLLEHSGFGRVFFANSGTEAIEGALKIARRWGSMHGKREIVSFTNAFHGRTMGALSMMDRQKYREGFGPFLEGFRMCEFNNPGALASAIGPSTAAVALECIQGEGGVRPITRTFADALRALQDQFGFLLIADEVQSGVWRTGSFFAFEHFGLQPDIVLLAKPIGGGLPLGAILGNERVAGVLEPGMHGTTFGGNPVACAAGVAVIREIQEERLMENASAMGRLMAEHFARLAAAFPSLIKEVRGIGLMQAIELTRDGEPAVAAMRDRHILINCTDKTSLRFLPPLIIGEEHVRQTCEALESVFRALP